MGLADRREAPADRRRGMTARQAGQIGADRRRVRRYWGESVLRAPGGVMRPVGPVGAQGRGCGGVPSQRAGRLQRREARRGRRETSPLRAGDGTEGTICDGRAR
jgi:hypothetical protein